jgi:hypothetical protein
MLQAKAPISIQNQLIISQFSMLLNPKPCANLMADAQKAIVSLSMK